MVETIYYTLTEWETTRWDTFGLDPIEDDEVDWRNDKILYVPLVASSWPLAKLGEELGYRVLSPCFDQMPYLDDEDTMFNVCGNNGLVGIVERVRATKIDGVVQVHEREDYDLYLMPELGSEVVPSDGIINMARKIEVDMVIKGKGYLDQRFTREVDFFLFADGCCDGPVPFYLLETPSSDFIGVDGLSTLFLDAYPGDVLTAESQDLPKDSGSNFDKLRLYYAEQILLEVQSVLGVLEPETELSAT